ncbi:SpoIIE family protein phosphatase [Kitasatospora sp. NPDC051914]|uniref:SpoIIE family protein phosphatase n=1 Tax=Kitasatospora sp. NPDC051914 TaxID=3154945 RepID=UPI0034333037
MADDGVWRSLPSPLRELLEGTPGAVGVLDTDLRYLYVNSSLARMNGVPAEEHIGRTIAEIVPGIDARTDVLRAVLADGIPRETTSSGQTRVPSPLARRYFHGAYHRLEVDGRIVGLAGIVLEVTASRQQQHELERARERLAMLDSASTMIGTTLDMDTTCVELARFLVPELGDIASVDVLPPSEDAPALHASRRHLRLRRASLVSVPELEECARALGKAGEYIDHQPGSATRRALETGRPVVENLPSDARLGRAAASPDRLAALRRAGVHSGMVAPLVARGRPLGTVTLIRAGSSPLFTQEDAVVVADLALRAAVSIDNARRFTREHGIALDLQRALLAEPGAPHPGLEVAFRYRPAGASALVGGDWYETVARPDGTTLLAIGDVMGHSLEAAVEMSHYQAMLRMIASGNLPPGRILDRMDRLTAPLAAGRPATCLAVVMSPETGVCTFASAGHLPPALIAPDGSVRLLAVEPGPPLATGFGGFPEVTAQCPPGHHLLLYTDGLVERRSEPIDASLARLTRLRLPRDAGGEQLLDAVLTGLSPTADDDVALLAATLR